MSTDRPFFQHSIVQLEELFASPDCTEATLRNLRDELARRGTMRAHALRRKVNDALDPLTGRFGAPAEPSLDFEADDHENAIHDVLGPSPATSYTPIEEPMPEIRNRPRDVLSAWTALEVLSPPSFRRPEQLAGGDRRMIAKISGGQYPWEKGEKSRPGSRLYFQVLLGVVDYAEAVTDLLKVYADERPDRYMRSEKAVFASVLVDREGRPVEEDCVAVSSFAWGLPIALKGGLDALGAWADIERSVVDELTKRLVSHDSQGEVRPLTKATIEGARRWLVERLGIPSNYVKSADFAVRVYMPFRRPDQPEPLLLNSFFLEDLAIAAKAFADGTAPTALRRFVGDMMPSRKVDLLQDKQAILDLLRPTKFPLARWPGPGRHPLVFLQQAAVNAFHEADQCGALLGVNGPPGTGKTTLLRDVVADMVTQRAAALATFSDPTAAFAHSGEKIKAGNHWLHLYRIDERLAGYELLVASSNNKAVENVSAELPAREALAEDSDLKYFKPLSDTLLERDTWGAIAAVLGNASNRSSFRNAFWWDEEVAFRRYLLELAGTPQLVVEEAQEEGHAPVSHRPKIIEEADLPPSEWVARNRWAEAKSTFEHAKARVEALLSEMEQFRFDVVHLPDVLTSARQLISLAAARPSFWARLFRTKRAREWSASNRRERDVYRYLLELANLPSAELQALAAGPTFRSADAHYEAAVSQLEIRVNELRRRKSQMGTSFVDRDLLEQGHHERQNSVPWFDRAASRARDDLFEASVQLHKAFIDCAAKPLRHNLGVLMTFFSGMKPSSPEVEALLPDMWRSLFLVIPAVSTTFASVHRMLGLLPKETIGCLVVDEAGQALPQAAVGALFRARRAVMVGDPIQVPPVVIMPEKLTSTICRRFGVDPNRFNAPEASAQTLADAASDYSADFESEQGSRTVGAPLLVHRRCSEPMFSVANEVAYSRLMVQGKDDRPSDVRDTLGPSTWFDIASNSVDKWSEDEGQKAVNLLRRLAAAGVSDDVFVVTPFVSVQNGMRRLIEEDADLASWLGEPRRWVFDRVGTIHTLQGREAEAVIFVLGAPRPSELGARNWAARQPNLLNVAVTRAKEALYVVGSFEAWANLGVFKVLARNVRRDQTA